MTEPTLDNASASVIEVQLGPKLADPAASPGDGLGEGAQAPSAEKLDPESLAIRARPPRDIRFRREVIIAASAFAAIAIAGVGWTALTPQLNGRGVKEREFAAPNLSPASPALDSLPKAYDEVPKLGAPLPGDLGRPILRAQERGMMAPSDAPAAVTANPAQAIAERREAELTAARQSSILAVSGNTTIASSSSGVVLPEASGAGTGEGGQASSVGQGFADRKLQFVEKTDDRPDTNPHALLSAASPYTLAAGSIIAASLVTGLNSDLPGMVIAQVSQNVYDSATGQMLLIPQGARLFGKYDRGVSYGQDRLLMVWQRLLMPDGSSIRLDNMPATDAAGLAGLSDKVDHHTARLAKGVVLSTLFGISTELSLAGESGMVRAIRDSTQTGAARAGDQITQRNLDVQPTISIRAGAPVRLIVRQDLILKPWKQEN